MSLNTMSGTGKRLGYVRTSAADQNPARQLEALAGCDRIFQDAASGKDVRGRPQLVALLDYARDGDVVVVKSADRLARSALDLLTIVQGLEEKGVAVEFVDSPNLNTRDKMGRFMLQLLASIAELERATIRERQAEGIAIAKAKGKYRKKPKLSPQDVEEMRAGAELGLPKAVLARRYDVSRTTVYDVLNRTGVYAEEASS